MPVYRYNLLFTNAMDAKLIEDIRNETVLTYCIIMTVNLTHVRFSYPTSLFSPANEGICIYKLTITTLYALISIEQNHRQKRVSPRRRPAAAAATTTPTC